MQAIGAADHVEAFGLTEDELREKGYRATPAEIIGKDNVQKLKDAGYRILQLVKVG
jgi:short subunit dehydrogenase-like uncharacterized protein